jgi:exosome complex component RRP4
VQDFHDEDSSDNDSEGGADLEGDIDMRPSKRARHGGTSSIVTPGEVITDDSQWMRYAIPFPPQTHQSKLS